MSDIEKLRFALQHFAQLTDEDFSLSEKFWHFKNYKKGDFYNEHKSVCQYLGFVFEGAFRSYVVDEKTNTEKNVFLYSANGFVVPFKSFINQSPCDYHTQAVTDSRVICINIFDLQDLYKRSHNWERFGRLAAQEAFNQTISRVESFIFRTPEERYLELVKQHPDIFNTTPLYHISSFLGIQGPSLSRIRKRLAKR